MQAAKTLVVAIVLLMCGCGTTGEKAKSADADNPAQVFKIYYEERLRLYPLDATYAGDNRFNDSLPNDISEAFRARERVFNKKYLLAVSQLEAKQLSAEDRLSCEILKWGCERELERLSFPMHLMPINQFESMHLIIGQFAGGTSAQPFKTVKDYENWLKRLDAFLTWLDTAKDNMRQGMKQGYVLPKALTVKVIPQFADLAHGPATNHLYFSPAKNFPTNFAAADRERLTREYLQMVEGRIIPAFAQMAEFLKNEYLPASRASSGISDVPRGAEFYQSQIRYFTTLDDRTPEVEHQLGLREVERITAEMNRVREQVGFKGDLRAFFDFVRKRPELRPFNDPQQVIDHFVALHHKVKPNVDRLFSLQPHTPLEIRRTEAFREASASAEWQWGSLDGSRPGIFYVPIPDVKAYNIIQDEALFLHEAIPGHHFQLSLQRENTKLPMFRRTLGLPTFEEGWALYCESLGKELGMYDDPYQYFGMLSMEMHRAIRLVVDTGLHAKGWTREQAIQYSLDHEAESEEGIIAEIERYMSWPGQALAYKTGQLKIRELRTRAEKAMGPKFDIRQYHTQVLESGSMPLRLLEQKIHGWIRTP